MLKRVMRSHRASIAAFALLAVLVLGGLGAALFVLPLLAIFALLASGRFVGEEQILALHVRRALRVRRTPARRWQPARPTPVRSLFARSPRTFRGPPAFAAVV
jgi:hypothetical protein